MIIKASTATVGTSTTTFSPWYLANRTEHLCKSRKLGEVSKVRAARYHLCHSYLSCTLLSALKRIIPSRTLRWRSPESPSSSHKGIWDPVYFLFRHLNNPRGQFILEAFMRSLHLGNSVWSWGALFTLRPANERLNWQGSTKWGGRRWCAKLICRQEIWELGSVETQPIHYGAIEPLGWESPR